MNPMTEVMRYRAIQARAAAKANRKGAIEGALSSLAMGDRPRVVRAVATAVLLGSPWAWRGRIIRVAGKSVGAGVWELREVTK